MQDYRIRTQSRRGKKENPRMSVDAALSLGCFIKLLLTFELDGREEVRLEAVRCAVISEHMHRYGSLQP